MCRPPREEVAKMVAHPRLWPFRDGDDSGTIRGRVSEENGRMGSEATPRGGVRTMMRPSEPHICKVRPDELEEAGGCTRPRATTSWGAEGGLPRGRARPLAGFGEGC